MFASLRQRHVHNETLVPIGTVDVGLNDAFKDDESELVNRLHHRCATRHFIDIKRGGGE